MDLRRLRAGEWVTAVSGVVLLVSLFLPWYHTSCIGAGGPAHCNLTGWQALGVTDLVLAVIAIGAITLFFVTASQPTAAIPIAYDSLLFLVSLVAGVLAVVRVLSLPGVAQDRAVGIWLALAGAIGISAGALVAMRNERLSPPGASVDATGRPAPPPPEIETIPTPPPSQEAG